MYGFTHPSLIYLLEQLPGAHRCHLYDFRYHRDHSALAAEDDDDVSPSLFAVSLHLSVSHIHLLWFPTAHEKSLEVPDFFPSNYKALESPKRLLWSLKVLEITLGCDAYI